MNCLECINYNLKINCFDCRRHENCTCFRRMSNETKEKMYERYIGQKEHYQKYGIF